jgi:hypothetical protein
MSNESIVAIVEGPGEVEALPILLRRIFEQKQIYQISIQKPINAHGLGNLTTPGGLERFLAVAEGSSSCDAILVLVDADINCAKNLALELANRSRVHNPHIATAVVAAKYRYESWFIYSLESLCGKRGFQTNLPIIDDPETMPNPKKFLTNNKTQGRIYRETTDQAPMSNLIDLNLVMQRSRSFCRLMHAVDELIGCITSGIPKITPIQPPCSTAD